MLERKWTGSGLTLGPQLSPGAQSIVRHNAVKQGRKERVCYKYTICHIMFNELILKGIVHPKTTKHKALEDMEEYTAWVLWIIFVMVLCCSFVLFFLDLTVFHFYCMQFMWITCALLWCFYEFFGLSFWRHPFTAENLLVRKWCNAKFTVPMKKKINEILDGLRMSTFSAILNFWVNYYFKFSVSSTVLLLSQYLLREPVRRASRFCIWLDGSAHRHPRTTPMYKTHDCVY